MKCDEAKPFCQRCLLRNGSCEGYDHTKAEHQKVRILAQRLLHPTLIRGLESSTSSNVPVRSPWEKAWFETWLSLSSKICGDELSQIFSGTVTQLSTQDDALRQAIFAVGSLKFTLDQSAGLPRGRNYRMSSLYETALSRYGCALRAVTAMPANDKTIQTILLCCILFACFDLLDGNHQSVHEHIKHGSQVLEQFLKAKSNESDLKTCFESPAPYIIDDTIIQIFQRCLTLSYIQIASRLSSSQQPTPLVKPPIEPWTILESKMPQDFLYLREAIKWMDLIQNAFISTLFSTDIAFRPNRRTLQPGQETNLRWQEARLGFLGVLHSWSVAFAALERMEHVKEKPNKEQLLHIGLTRMQWHNAYILIHTSHYSNYKALVEMEYMFKAIVTLAKRHLKDLSQGSPVTLLTTAGPVLPLFGKSCHIYFSTSTR